jgi:predicted MFS family arabinose efflux permease
MLGVAGAALGGVDGRQVTVVAAMLSDVSRDVLVTGEAQGSLATAVAAVVALRALLLVLGVRGRQLPGHEERLGIHGLSLPRRKESA